LKSSKQHLALAIAIPFATFAVQSALWRFLSPYPWFLFYPTVFLIAVSTDLLAGAVATVVATLLACYFFLPPYHGFVLDRPTDYFSVVLFAITGFAFSLFSQRLRELERRRAAAETSHVSDARYRSLFENSLEGVLLNTTDGRILSANHAAQQIFAYSEEELRAIGHRGLTHWDDPAVQAAIATRMQTGRFCGELNLIRKSGEPFPAEVSSQEFTGEDGARMTSMVIRDITDRKKADLALIASQNVLHVFIESAPAAIAMFDLDMRYMVVSRRWLDEFQLTGRDIVGCTHYEVFPELSDEWKLIHRRAMAGETITAAAEPFPRSDGSVQWLRWEVRPWYHQTGSIGGVVQFTEDISNLRHAEDQLRVTSRIFDQAGEAIMIADPDSIIRSVNAAFCKITGYSAEEAIGQATTLLKSGRQSAAFYQDMWQSLHSAGYWQGEIWNRRKSGEVYPQWLTINRVDDDQGKITHYIGVFSDITQLKESQQKIEFLATHDTLTGLPNRALFNDRLNFALLQMHRHQKRLALMFIDLDNFKSINDTLGHAYGDQLLQQVAIRLSSALRDVDTVARLGGDEFTAILTDCSVETANHVALRVIEHLAAPYDLQGRSLYVSASAGVAFYPEDGGTASELTKSADAAMYRAKEQGRNRVEFFMPELQLRLQQRANLETALRDALRHDRLRLTFQPKIALTHGHRIMGAEALLRLRDPSLGEISPADFIPIAENTGLIVEVDRAVQRLLLQYLTQWLAEGLSVPTIAFNTSTRGIKEPHYVQHLIDAFKDADVPTSLVQLEIIEGALLENTEQVFSNLNMLASAKVRISIDDFGTGYSSLSYLKRLPLSELKIDKCFVKGLGQNREDEAIASAVLALANALGLTTVAEGVETLPQLEWLESMGCDMAQGYYFSKPLEADEFKRKWLQAPH